MSRKRKEPVGGLILADLTGTGIGATMEPHIRIDPNTKVSVLADMAWLGDRCKLWEKASDSHDEQEKDETNAPLSYSFETLASRCYTTRFTKENKRVSLYWVSRTSSFRVQGGKSGHQQVGGQETFTLGPHRTREFTD